jgi:hypothetical protein
VSLLDRLRPRPRAEVATAQAHAELDLAALTAALQAAVPALERAALEPLLVRARLADRCRDLGLEPLDPDLFDSATAGLPEPAWRRLALTVAALDTAPVREGLKPALARNLAEAVQGGLVGFAREAELLTLDLLRQSPLRLEEFARAWAARLGAGIAREKPEESKARLERLDYKRLLDEAERAKKAAEDRDYLKKLQEAEDKKRAPRGKW